MKSTHPGRGSPFSLGLDSSSDSIGHNLRRRCVESSQWLALDIIGTNLIHEVASLDLLASYNNGDLYGHLSHHLRQSFLHERSLR